MSILSRLAFHFRYIRRERPIWDTNVSPPELMEFIATRPPGKALDLGCGTGTNAITLAQNGWQVTGVDFAWSAIRIARRKAMQAKVAVNFQVEDITRFKGFTGQYDLILDIGCYHNISPDRHAAYIRILEQFLDTRGTYLLYVYFKKDTAERGPGVVEADIEAISTRLNLISRKDGTERGRRPSAWFTFTKSET
jgi:cyclopropane fatty-acyl-phospholipid synthase-like methyltransferase